MNQMTVNVKDAISIMLMNQMGVPNFSKSVLAISYPEKLKLSLTTRRTRINLIFNYPKK